MSASSELQSPRQGAGGRARRALRRPRSGHVADGSRFPRGLSPVGVPLRRIRLPRRRASRPASTSAPNPGRPPGCGPSRRRRRCRSGQPQRGPWSDTPPDCGAPPWHPANPCRFDRPRRGRRRVSRALRRLWATRRRGRDPPRVPTRPDRRPAPVPRRARAARGPHTRAQTGEGAGDPSPQQHIKCCLFVGASGRRRDENDVGAAQCYFCRHTTRTSSFL